MSSLTVSRVLVEALTQTRDGSKPNFAQIASQARTTVSNAQSIIEEFLPKQERLQGGLSSSRRLQLALYAARNGLLLQAAKALTWQEFENIAIECLQIAGFETIKGVMTRGQGRKWQIDLTGKKGSMLLAFDCKHWRSSYSPARIAIAAKHQREAVNAMLRDLKSRKMFPDAKLLTLPVILTLLEPRDKIVDDTVLVSLEKLADFLAGVTQYSNEMPFIASDTLMESPIC